MDTKPPTVRSRFMWHLRAFFQLPTTNGTGCAMQVHGSTYSITVQPGECTTFGHDDAPVGY